MLLNLTLPGLGDSKGSSKPAAQQIVKNRYWTPDPDDVTVYRGNPDMQGEAPAGYSENDAFYKNKVWDKKTSTWIKGTDDIYRTNKDTGDQLQWQAPTPKKKGLMK